MLRSRFLLVEESVLPEVFIKVMKAKELLANGKAKNTSQAVQLAGLSRSAFYKYKDSVFNANSAHGMVTLSAVLLDETGALQSLLAALSQAGASVVTINQSQPSDGTASVSVTMRTDDMLMSVDEALQMLKNQPTVLELRISA